MADERCPSATGGGSRSHIKNRYQSCGQSAMALSRADLMVARWALPTSTGTVDWGSAAASWPPPLVGELVALWDGIHCKSFTVKRSFDRTWQAGKGGLR